MSNHVLIMDNLSAFGAGLFVRIVLK